MTRLITARTRLEAWLAAARDLASIDSERNVVLAIAQPAAPLPGGPAAIKEIDAFCSTEGQMPVHTVAETIFPAWEYRRRGLNGVFDTYVAEYRLFKAGNPGRWGTYAHRLVVRDGPNGTTVNPLLDMIQKMRAELALPRGMRRSCYELGIEPGSFDIPIYDTVGDRWRRRGLPCLSHLSFKLDDGAIHLTAMYRSHDYRYKALGNLLGLARLQACVAREVDLAIGELVVHSTYAYVDRAKGRARFLKLLARAGSLIAAHPT